MRAFYMCCVYANGNWNYHSVRPTVRNTRISGFLCTRIQIREIVRETNAKAFFGALQISLVSQLAFFACWRQLICLFDLCMRAINSHPPYWIAQRKTSSLCAKSANAPNCTNLTSKHKTKRFKKVFQRITFNFHCLINTHCRNRSLGACVARTSVIIFITGLA